MTKMRKSKGKVNTLNKNLNSKSIYQKIKNLLSPYRDVINFSLAILSPYRDVIDFSLAILSLYKLI